ncbi:MAG: NAD(P)H-binding protein [Verrucomicrobia bacterium]|nr:NAD(P)H-binding protein [Verrucomicrobiota bacterium]
MKIAITGGTGFVGGHLARVLAADGHEVGIIARGSDGRDKAIRQLPSVTFHASGTHNEDRFFAAFAGCDVVAHCAGINREHGAQTYARVHCLGTQCVVNAARRAGVKKIVLVSFLRARPNCGSGYHESKFAAEEIVRASGLDYTIFKPGVIYGRGDHMLDHLSHAFHTFPVFAFVGFKEKLVAPLAVADFVHVMQVAIVTNRMQRQTVAVVGPEAMPLTEAVRRVARAVGKRPLMFPLPLWFHYAFAWLCEQTMTIPLISIGQVRILSEGVADPLPTCDEVPDDLKPRRHFTAAQIRAGLPKAKAFGLTDCRWSNFKFRKAL